MTDRYPVPRKRHRVSEMIKKSRFIATMAPAATPEAAKIFVDQVRTEFADASHHCWAFVAGAPGTTARIGMSDDGEPHGTAGRPMLNILLHSGIGEIAAVVTRYFGGVKLGTGGLVRAYSGLVQKAIASLPVEERFNATTMNVRIDYAQWPVLKQLAQSFGATIVREIFKEDVSVALRLPEDRADGFIAAVKGRTGDRVTIHRDARHDKRR